MTRAPFAAVPGDGRRTRIKFCGMTRDEDVDTALSLGVEALGFVFYRPSPRYVAPAAAARLIARMPPTVEAVGLFVDAPRGEIDAIVAATGLTMLQFHGDETAVDCSGHGLPYLRAARMLPELDLLDFAARNDEAFALLLDAPSVGYGGSGKVFDWSLVPPSLRDTLDRSPSRAGVPRVVLSGGLSAANVADGVRRLRPYAVDVSSGIERAKGIKDPAAMRDFVAAVRSADRSALQE